MFMSFSLTSIQATEVRRHLNSADTMALGVRDGVNRSLCADAISIAYFSIGGMGDHRGVMERCIKRVESAHGVDFQIYMSMLLHLNQALDAVDKARENAVVTKIKWNTL